MPTPLPNESEKEYLGRCMGWGDLQSTDASQRAAICHSKWDEHLKASKKSLPMGLIVLKALPVVELFGPERCDVSTITSKSIDAEGDIVMPEGLDWDRFHEDGSPVHYAHHSLRVGRALWVKAKGDRIIAKTRYDSAPAGWSKDKSWIGDVVFDAVRKGALPGKSITVLPEEDRKPTDEEKAAGCKRVITKGTVMEFSVCKAPVNQDAVVEEICKSLDAFNPVVVEALNQAGHLDELVARIGLAFDELAGSR